MKKKYSVKKLCLARETVSRLDDALKSEGVIAGGQATYKPDSGCNACRTNRFCSVYVC